MTWDDALFYLSLFNGAMAVVNAALFYINYRYSTMQVKVVTLMAIFLCLVSLFTSLRSEWK